METITAKDLVNMVDHVINHGRDYEYYTLYFKDGSECTVTESEFVAQDELYEGELALKVIN